VNAYLTKLRRLGEGIHHTGPSSKYGFEGFEGGEGTRFSRSGPRGQAVQPRSATSPLPTSEPAAVEMAYEGYPHYPQNPQNLPQYPEERLQHVLGILDGRCPDYVDHNRWRQAVGAGRRFLSSWGAQAQAFGWTAQDLFALHAPLVAPAPSYRRLSRYDAMGLDWLLDGREVIALTKDTTAIRGQSGSVTTYRKNNKSACGPVTKDEFDLTVWKAPE